jgi:hypothetical protein
VHGALDIGTLETVGDTFQIFRATAKVIFDQRTQERTSANRYVRVEFRDIEGREEFDRQFEPAG